MTDNNIDIEETEYTKKCADRLLLFVSFKRNFKYLALEFGFSAICQLILPQIAGVKCWYIPFFSGCLLYHVIKKYDTKRFIIKFEIFLHLLFAIICFALFNFRSVVWWKFAIMGVIMAAVYLISGYLADKTVKDYKEYIRIKNNIK